MVSIRNISCEDTEAVFHMMRSFYDSPAVLNDVPDKVIETNIRNVLSDFPYLEGFVFENCGGLEKIGESL